MHIDIFKFSLIYKNIKSLYEDCITKKLTQHNNDKKFKVSNKIIKMRIKNLKEYISEKNKFDLDPERFWAEKAEKFNWHQKWNEILNWDFYKAKVNWFSGGKLNITENCLDRHLK